MNKLRNRYRRQIGIKTDTLLLANGRGLWLQSEKVPMPSFYTGYSSPEQPGPCGAHCVRGLSSPRGGGRQCDGLPAGEQYPTNRLGQWIHYTGTPLSVRWTGTRIEGERTVAYTLYLSTRSAMFADRKENGNKQNTASFSRRILGLSDSRG